MDPESGLDGGAGQRIAESDISCKFNFVLDFGTLPTFVLKHEGSVSIDLRR